MAKYIERFIKKHITGDNPEAVRDFRPSLSIEDEDSRGIEAPDISILESIEDPRQITPMIENEAQGTLIGFITGIAAAVLQRIATYSEGNHEKKD